MFNKATIAAMPLDELHELIHNLQKRCDELERESIDLKRKLKTREIPQDKSPSVSDTQQDVNNYRDLIVSGHHPNLLRRLIDSVGDLIYVKNREGAYIACNAASEKFIGIKESDQIGKTDFDFFNREFAEAIRDKDNQIFSSGKEDHVEEWVISAEGKRVLLDSLKAPFYGPEGTIAGLVGISRDITERKQAEEELREGKQQLRNIVENSTNLFYMHTTDNILTYVSPQSLQFFDCEPEEVMVLWTELITDNPVNRIAIEATQRAIDTGERQPPYQVECVGKKGRKIWVEVNETPLVENKATVAIVGSLTDITEQKLAQEKIEKLNSDLAARALELENANLELEAFNYSVSHDLRRPLTIIHGYCNIIKRLCGESLDTKCREYLEMIVFGAQSMNQLIDVLLKFSSLKYNQLHRENIDLSEIANAVASELALTDAGRRVSFRIADGITADCDADLMRMVFENLLGNAWKYTSTCEEAVIEFGMKEVDGTPTYIICDNGIGFDMVHADKVFMPFQRFHRMDAEGHGIGLSIVERIVKRHGGKLWAEGIPGKGATFYFTL
jgi:PAS domain S-box-containing protein